MKLADKKFLTYQFMLIIADANALPSVEHTRLALCQ